MHSESSSSLTITGLELDPDQITSRTGVTPTKTWRSGDRINDKSVLRYHHSGWSLASGISPDQGIDEHMRAVLSRIERVFPVFVELCARYEAELACVIYVYGADRPAIHLPAELVKKISALGAQIDVDLYVLPE